MTNKSKILKINQVGLSLIEIMVAFSILVIAFVGLVQSFPFGLSVNKSAENSTIASYLAQAKLEELVSLGYDNINVGIIEAKHRLSDDSANYLYNFQRQTEVNYVDSELVDSIGDQGMKKISSTIYFINAFYKQEENYNITTLISGR